jgi:acyl-CoA synthetase (AMP-forming)/AMP-acid ligase II/heme oxygenase
MLELFERIRTHASERDSKTALSLEGRNISYSDLFSQIVAAASSLKDAPSTVALLMPRDERHIASELALTCLGCTVVPLPDFFSDGQVRHILSDANVQAVVTVPELTGRFKSLDLPLLTPSFSHIASHQPFQDGKRIIYTSGTTGKPKGVVLGGKQVIANLKALEVAACASPDDRHLSVLPFSLLLEQLAGIYLPLWVGAEIHVIHDPRSLPAVAQCIRPTTTVLVPDLLKAWVRWLRGAKQQAPDSLRLVAVGGAPVSAGLAEMSWEAGIPVHEGYGLSECASVVALNRVGERAAGTVGRPLPGIEVQIDQGEIVVAGPTVMEGYLGGHPTDNCWRTGDLGYFNEAGHLIVLGRKDDVIVTDNGRNIHPEWIEPMLLADQRIARAAVIGGGSCAVAVVVPYPDHFEFLKAASADVLGWLVQSLCADAPDYARPRKTIVLSFEEAAANALFTLDGRPRRRHITHFLRRRIMTFYDDLQDATSAERHDFMSIPLIKETIAHGVDIPLYRSFLESAYHHVRHTVSLLELAIEGCGPKDQSYRAGLQEYVKEETGHDEWILEDIADMGGDAAQVRDALGPYPVRMLVAYAYYATQHISPYALLGMVHVLEGMSVALAVKAAESIGARLGKDLSKGFRYLTSHGNLDIEHVDLFAKLLDIIDSPERRDLVIQSAKDFYRLYGDVFRELEVKRRQVAYAA